MNEIENKLDGAKRERKCWQKLARSAKYFLAKNMPKLTKSKTTGSAKRERKTIGKNSREAREKLLAKNMPRLTKSKTTGSAKRERNFG